MGEVLPLLGASLIVVSVFGFLGQILAIVDYRLERKNVRPAVQISRASRAKRRLLLCTFVFALAVAPVIGFVTNLITARLSINETEAFAYLVLFVLLLGIVALVFVSKMIRSDEDDYWDYSVLQKDLEDNVRDHIDLPRHEKARLRKILTRLDIQEEDSFSAIELRVLRKNSLLAASINLPNRDEPLEVFERVFPSVDASVVRRYIGALRKRSFGFTVTGVIGAALFLAGLGKPATASQGVLVVVFFVVIPVVCSLISTFCLARSRLINALSWRMVKLRQSRDCHAILGLISAESKPHPEAKSIYFVYYPIRERIVDAIQTLRAATRIVDGQPRDDINAKSGTIA